MSTAGPRNDEHRFFAWAALLTLPIVLAGFAQTYYLKHWFGTPALPWLVHLHGLVMSAWFVLLAVQARLAGSGRIQWHRRLGMAGMALAVAVLVVGTAVAIRAVHLGHAPRGAPPLVFLVVPLGDMLVFALLVGSALALRRRRPDAHKRLMLLSGVGLLTAAIARIPWPPWHDAGLPAYFGTTSVLVLACVIYDSWRHRRLHPAFAWGGALVILSWPLRLMLAGTPAWLAFAQWLARG